ncbi:hypothetical protein, partial [Streptomyces sp. ZEA17I]|uniref:hypothetical protein n=1 Tax=Streptomyces sp. ZEA17I TaxID=2202516 RepID=UPI001C642E7A
MGLMSWLRGGLGARSGGVRSGGDAGASVGADRRERVDVNRLAPLQRVVSAQQLTFASMEFEASLTTRQDTALGRPLGHLVSPDAPGGLLRGVGVVEGAAPGAGVASASVAQRAVEMPLREGAVTFFGPRVGGG